MKNNEFDTTKASSMLKLSFNWKGYGIKDPTLYVIDLVQTMNVFCGTKPMNVFCGTKPIERWRQSTKRGNSVC